MSSAIPKKPEISDSDQIDLGRLFGELLDYRKLIFTITGIFIILSVVYATFATPVYEADALVQVEQKEGNALINSLSQMLPGGEPTAGPEIYLLQSRMILGKTVDDLDLQANITQNYFPIFGRGWARLKGEKPGVLTINRLYLESVDGNTPVLTLTVEDKGNYKLTGKGINLQGSVGQLLESKGLSLNVNKMEAPVGTSFTVRYLTRLDAINILAGAFKPAEQGKDTTGILNLTLTGTDPDQVELILNSITENYLAQNISREAAQDAKSLQFLNQQLPKVRSDLDNAENKLNAYRRQIDSVDISLEARSALEQIVNVDNQLNQLTFREAEISQLYTKTHPTYKALLEQRKTLEDEKAALTHRISGMPASQQQVLSLSRDVDSGHAIYMQLLNRQQELSIAKSSAIGNVRIIDDAVTQPGPVKPKKVLVVLVGFILGLVLSVGIVLLKVFMRRGIESPEQLEELGINVYASIPYSDWLGNHTKQQQGRMKFSRQKLGKTHFLAFENPADLAIESIRGLRTSLHFAMMEAKNNVLMISGASPKAGKTFISTNLAAILAAGEQRVLLIDADMRKGYVHKMFNTDIENGLSDILSGKTTIQNGIKKVSGSNLDFISRGQIPPNPVELLMHARFEQLIEWASQNYDIVLVDTAPVLAVTDAAVIGRYAGTSLLVARFESNTVKEMEYSIRRFALSGVEIKGLILNGIVRKASSYYGYGYSGYSYSYSDKD